MSEIDLKEYLKTCNEKGIIVKLDAIRFYKSRIQKELVKIKELTK